MPSGVRFGLRFEILDLLFELLGEDLQLVDLGREVLVILAGLLVQGDKLDADVIGVLVGSCCNHNSPLGRFVGVGNVLCKVLDPPLPLEKNSSPDGLLFWGKIGRVGSLRGTRWSKCHRFNL